MQSERTLMNIGFTEEEAKSYVELLKSGSSLASSLSSKTRINRSQTYYLLDRMIAKGYVSYAIRNNTRYYSAVAPESVLRLFQEKENELKQAIPALSSLRQASPKKPMVEVFEGKEGLKTVLNDILRVKKEWLGFVSSGQASSVLPYSVEHWEKERQKLGIPLRAIMDLSTSGKKRGKELSHLKHTQIRYIPQEYSSPTSTWVYGDRVVVLMWSEENPVAIRTISETLAKSYSQHFDNLWKMAKPVGNKIKK